MEYLYNYVHTYLLQNHNNHRINNNDGFPTVANATQKKYRDKIRKYKK